jgi:hypothetical protein
MGHHIPMYQGKKQVNETGKRKGEIRDPEMMIHLIFEFTNAKFAGDYPLTVKTSVPFGKNGDLLNKLSIGKGLEEGWLARKHALKANYVKTLMAMQDATGASSGAVADYVGKVFGCTVVHNLGKKAADNGDIPMYANMKCTSIVAPEFKNPIDGKTTKMDLPEQIGEYCPVFDWESPTIEAWSNVPKYLKPFIQKAIDYPGSELEMLIAGYEAAVAEDNKDAEGAADTDAPAQLDPKNDTERFTPPDDDIPF